MIERQKNIIIQGQHDKPILIDTFYNKNSTSKPIVIFCHGYKGFKDWGAWDLVAEAFANAGYFFIKFNFSHNGGTVNKPIDFPDLEAFGQNNYIKELDDLETVIDWITSIDSQFKNETNTANISLIGHSRGGGITIIKASEDSRISKLITWASVSDFKKRFPEKHKIEQWEKDGVMFIENGRTKQQMPHYFQFYTSFLENEKRLTISTSVSKINIPYLIIHGNHDPTVTIEEGKKIHKLTPESELFIVEGADHVFGAKHPWDMNRLSSDLEKVTQKTIDFIGF